MARSSRETLPQVTLLGKIPSDEELEPLLAQAELDGMLWSYRQSGNTRRRARLPTGHEILALHRIMFGSIYEWAGTTRWEARGRCPRRNRGLADVSDQTTYSSGR